MNWERESKFFFKGEMKVKKIFMRSLFSVCLCFVSRTIAIVMVYVTVRLFFLAVGL